MDVACDACCLINLMAADCILPAPSRRVLKGNLFIPLAVAAESLYLLRPDPEGGDMLVKAAIDLEPYFQSGALAKCHVQGDGEIDLFVRFATTLDDGEAECLAIAMSRGLTLATDDRLAARLAQENGVSLINTAQLVKKWAVDVGASSAEIAATLSNIQKFARFVPRALSPEAKWWREHITQ
jgi:hypothetical protein